MNPIILEQLLNAPTILIYEHKLMCLALNRRLCLFASQNTISSSLNKTIYQTCATFMTSLEMPDFTHISINVLV